MLAFLAVALMVIVTPGPDTALTIRNTLLGGRRNGLATALGVVTGQATWTVAASAGVAALLVASEPAFIALRIAGATYLVFLGVQALVAAWRPARPGHGESSPRTPALVSVAYRQGLISNLGNPKAAAFFTSLLPQFATSFAAMLALGAVFCSLTLVWLSAYAVVVARAGDFLRRSAIRRALDAATGAVLVALGFRVASGRP